MIPVDRLRVDDVRLVLRSMLDTVRLAEHPVARAKSLLSGLCKVLGARRGLYAASLGSDARGRVQWDWLVEAGPGPAGTPATRRWITVTAPQDSRRAMDFQALCNAAEPLAGVASYSRLPIPHPPVAGGVGPTSGNSVRKAAPAPTNTPAAEMATRSQNIGLCRWAGDIPFDGRDLAILQLVHWEISSRLFATPPPDLQQSLTPRLCEVLELLIKGMGTKQIAYKLGLSRFTVQDYVQEIYKRFNVRGRNELHARLHQASSLR